MFASLFRHQRLGLPPERTPLLQAFHRSRYRDDADADADANDYLGSREHGHDDDDEQHDEDDAQDEPLLPVFSEFLGTSAWPRGSRKRRYTWIQPTDRGAPKFKYN